VSLPDHEYAPAVPSLSPCPLCVREMPTLRDNDVIQRDYDVMQRDKHAIPRDNDVIRCRPPGDDEDFGSSVACRQLSVMTTSNKEDDSLAAVTSPITDDDEDHSVLCCSASSSDDEELLCLRLDRAMMSSSDEESVSCCFCSGCDDADSHPPDVDDDARCADSDSLGSNNACDNEIESEVDDDEREEEEDDEGFVSFKFDDYPESVYEGVAAHPCQLYVNGYCLCASRLRPNLNESVKSR
jgi:hypothetical protein